MTTRVLLVDDDASFGELMRARLTKRGFEVTVCGGSEQALSTLERQDLDVVVTDVHMNGADGITLCTRVVESRPDVPVIVLTGFGSLDTAVASIRAGAYDFLTKPVEVDALGLALDRAATHRSLRAEVRRLREQVAATASVPTLIGDSQPMRELRDLVARVAETEATTLITGESGSGKEVVARALHDLSARRNGPFVALNCAAMPEKLLESELFGHVRGAFTGAMAANVGLFARAHGGTLFLDEVGDMPLALQPKLLRVLEERKVRPLGGGVEVPVDLRIVCATNRDLRTAVDDREFRDDLYFRIAVVHVEVPPLRSRMSDVLPLAQHFIRDVAGRFNKRVTGISATAANLMLAYPWPGNVRELRNCIERAVALAQYEELRVDDLPSTLRSYKPSHVVVASDDPLELVSLAEVERRYILRVLEAVQGNRTMAARVLQVDRRTLYRKLESFGIDSKHEP